jgi:hypothetical protein
MSAEAGLVAILIAFPVYLLYTNKLKTYLAFASSAATT